MFKYILPLVLAASLTAGCATTPSATQSELANLAQNEIFQNALAEAAILRVVEKSKNPVQMANKILALASADMQTSVTQPLVELIHAGIGYSKLQASEQVLVDAVVAALNKDIEAATGNVEAQLAVVERWRGVAVSAATRYLAAKG